MRDLNAELKSHLQRASTTTCTCWIVKRKDETVLGFTDHDRPLEIEGTICTAASGFQPTEAVSELGLSPDNQDIEGAISTDAITEADLDAGRFDNARVEIWLVNWAAPDDRHLMRVSILSEVSRLDRAFRGELRGISSLLDQAKTRTYGRSCDAVLGDARCRFDADDPAYKTTGTVSALIDRLTLQCTGIGGYALNWFGYGNLTWVAGENAGLSVELSGGGNVQADTLKLWTAMPAAPTIGDTFVLIAGCDKTFKTCRSKFANGVNFQGFPHIPGSDFALSYPAGSVVHDGSPLVE